MFPFFFFFLFACNQRFTRFPFLSSRSLFPTRFNLTLPPPRRILFSSRFRRSGGIFRRSPPGWYSSRLWEIVEIQYFVTPKHTRPQMLFILSPKSGPRSDFLPNVVLFGLFLLSAISYLKIAFIFAPATHPKALHVLSKTFRPPRSGTRSISRTCPGTHPQHTRN